MQQSYKFYATWVTCPTAFFGTCSVYIIVGWLHYFAHYYCLYTQYPIFSSRGMISNGNKLELILDNSRFFGGGDTLSGTVHLVVKEPLGIDVEIIKVQLICAVEVNIEKHDQNMNGNNKDVSHRTKLYEKDINLIPNHMHLDFGTHDFLFSFNLPWDVPTLPPTCSDRINSETNASISHYVKASVRKGKVPFLAKNEFSKKTYFTFIPRSLAPALPETEEIGFVSQLSSQSKDKIMRKQALDTTKTNYSQLNPCGRERDKKLARVTRAVESASISLYQKSEPSVSLICGLILPSKGIRQDGNTDFSLTVTAANKNDIVVIKSLRMSIHTIIKLKVGNSTHESITEMTRVYQKSMSMTGNQLNITGDIAFNSPLLPSFETPHVSHSHKLELQLEISQIANCQILESTTVIEVIPINLFSYFTLPMDGGNLYRSIFDEEFDPKDFLAVEEEHQLEKNKHIETPPLQQKPSEDITSFQLDEQLDEPLHERESVSQFSI